MMTRHAGGRPRFQIDYALAEKLSNIHCTLAEIAAFLGCSRDTLERNEQFCGIYKKGWETSKISLRRLQWEAADSGNVTMLIWLGKQYLGQRDHHDVGGQDGGAIPHAITVQFVGAPSQADPATPAAGAACRQAELTPIYNRRQ